jgi:hypothetical protein
MSGLYIYEEDNAGAHHAGGLVDANLMYKKTVTGCRYPRACRFRKYQFENRSWLKLAKIDRFSNFLGLFSRFSGRGTHQRQF